MMIIELSIINLNIKPFPVDSEMTFLECYSAEAVTTTKNDYTQLAKMLTCRFVKNDIAFFPINLLEYHTH